MTDEQIKHMVDRFLGWSLPDNFQPDSGISFEPEFNVEWNAKHGNPPARHQPSGTNLLDAGQAEVMMRYLVENMPAGDAEKQKFALEAIAGKRQWPDSLMGNVEIARSVLSTNS